MAAESAAQLFSRLGSKQSLNGLDNQLFSDLPHGIKPGDIIEFHGSEGCGKTEMLIHLIANCILPQTWKDVYLGGRGVGVVFVDTDFHFQLLRLVTVLEYRIERAVQDLKYKPNKKMKDSNVDAGNDVSQNTTEQDIEEFIKACLTRLYIVRCNSSIEVLASLISLEQMLTTKTELCVIMIDSLSAFYWIDRSTGGESTTDQEENIRRTILTIQKYAKEFHMVVIVTTHAIFTSNYKNKETSDNYLCKSWLGIVKYKYLFQSQGGYDTRATSSQLFIVQRTLPRSNRFQRFSITDKGILFTS